MPIPHRAQVGEDMGHHHLLKGNESTTFRELSKQLISVPTYNRLVATQQATLLLLVNSYVNPRILESHIPAFLIWDPMVFGLTNHEEDPFFLFPAHEDLVNIKMEA